MRRPFRWIGQQCIASSNVIIFVGLAIWYGVPFHSWSKLWAAFEAASCKWIRKMVFELMISEENEDGSFVEQVGVRHGLLVDKKFLEGLTKRESNELAQINRLLDASEEKYYAPIMEALATVRASFLKETKEDE